MMSRRLVHRGLVVAVGWGLLAALLAGCGSVTGSTAAGGGASTSAGASGMAAAGAAASAAPRIGCASVNQATMVTVGRVMRPLLPRGLLPVIDRNPALVRALFRDFCEAVTHPNAPSGLLYCPVDFGTDYVGVFYDGSRVLARYVYAASGCQRVSITAGSTTQSTLVAGRAIAAAPHLATDWAAVLGAAKPTAVSSSQVNPGGPNIPA
jgi:hypothetical protein